MSKAARPQALDQVISAADGYGLNTLHKLVHIQVLLLHVDQENKPVHRNPHQIVKDGALWNSDHSTFQARPSSSRLKNLGHGGCC